MLHKHSACEGGKSKLLSLQTPVLLILRKASFLSPVEPRVGSADIADEERCVRTALGSAVPVQRGTEPFFPCFLCPHGPALSSQTRISVFSAFWFLTVQHRASYDANFSGHIKQATQLK